MKSVLLAVLAVTMLLISCRKSMEKPVYLMSDVWVYLQVYEQNGTKGIRTDNIARVRNMTSEDKIELQFEITDLQEKPYIKAMISHDAIEYKEGMTIFIEPGSSYYKVYL